MIASGDKLPYAGDMVFLASSSTNPMEAEQRKITNISGKLVGLDRPVAHETTTRYHGSTSSTSRKTSRANQQDSTYYIVYM